MATETDSKKRSPLTATETDTELIKKVCLSPSSSNLSHSPTNAPASVVTNEEGDSNIGGYFDELEDEEVNSSIQDEEDGTEASGSALDFEPDTNTSRPSEDRKIMALLAHFSEDQLNRFETFRRATFAKACVKRVMHSVLNTTVNQNVAIAMAGMTKVFVGELLDEAFAYRDRLGENIKLQPRHVREAARILQEENKTSTAFRPGKHAKQKAPESVGYSKIALVKDLCQDYVNKTPQRLKLIDVYLLYVLLTGVMQFIYCCLVGTFPFNAFLSGFISCVGSFIFGVCLRMHTDPTNKELFSDFCPERAFGEFIFAHLVLHLIVFNFIG
ncbi:Dolichyl-diphosphooligosaccharide-protein glycosyltransferase subunit dad1 [Cichlidogyrus casuarinus]|uniref:Dolichyl-diphosphooligosaccharide--protein glycosyltransferase subunit DAD1 n=1 Tax=Cichlidogyrus casuarinus TaxID=1844966 RepID=A0ABD2QCA3_9PLAT